MKERWLDVLQRGITKMLRFRKSTGDAWMFHCIEAKEQWDNPQYAITPATFEQLIISAKEAGKQFATTEKLEQGSEETIYITFDDGYAGVYRFAMEICEKHQVPFSVFVTTGFVGKKGYLSEDELKKLAQNPLCIIGAHTLSHPRLKTLSYEQQKKEIGDSGRLLGEWIGARIRFFAYPYGGLREIDYQTVKVAKKSGYERAFSTFCAHTSGGRLTRYIQPRINMNEESARKLIDEYSNCSLR